MVSSRQKAMIIITAHSESKLIKLTLLCDVDSLIKSVGSELTGWQKNIVTAGPYNDYLRIT